MTSDSQPVDIYPQRIDMPADRAHLENHIVPVSLRGFNGFASYVGTININEGSTRNWLQRELAVRNTLSLDVACRELAGELTSIWSAQLLDMWLSIFLAGYEDGESRYWYVSNGGFPTGEAEFPRAFAAVDDLDGVWLPRTAQPGESKDQLLARAHPSFRRGVLSAASIFDSYTAVVEYTMRAGHLEFQPFDSLDRFAAYTRFRFEFTKRMYDPKYGIGIDSHPPVRGEIRVVSIDPTGVRRVHGKHLRQVTILP
jgi:hypothetical protein